jgi:AAA ATPase-like protein
VFAVANPQVLATDWFPPVALGREREVRELVRRLDPPVPSAPPPWIVAVSGPPGSGTSTVARRAARETVDRVREAITGPAPRIIGVRTAFARGAHGIATELLRRFDEGFDGRGFPVAEILAGFFRRLRRSAAPTILVLDDVGVGGADLGPLLAALGNPDRFLPEGENGLPPQWTILAGSPEGLSTAVAGVSEGVAIRPFLDISPYSSTALSEVVRDRAERALGRAPPAGVVEGIVARAVADGGGARRAIELLRRELLGPGGRATTPWGRLEGPGELWVEPRVLRAIGAASGGVAARLGEVKRVEAELAVREGVRPLPTTTLWRRIVRLERAGYLRREIRPGGMGGTRSIVRLLRPIEEWVTDPRRKGTLRGGGAPGGEEAARTWATAGAPPAELRFRPGG